MTFRYDNVVELEEFFPDIEPELPRCPAPVMELRIRDAIIEICERANVWRWEHPEIPVRVGVQEYDFVAPAADLLVHSVLNLSLNGMSLEHPFRDDVHTHGEMRYGAGYTVLDRGRIRLNTKPTLASSPKYITLSGAAEASGGTVQAVYALNEFDPDNGFSGFRALSTNDPLGFRTDREYDVIFSTSIDDDPAYSFAEAKMDRQFNTTDADVIGTGVASPLPIVDTDGSPVNNGDPRLVSNEPVRIVCEQTQGHDDPIYDFDRFRIVVASEAVIENPNRERTGISAVLSIKPSRKTLEVSEVLVRDYYQLVVTGTLAKAFMMLERPWTNVEMGKEKEKQFEYQLARAKQALDRGFRTAGQRIRPRKFG